MSISMYSASVPIFVRTLTNLLTWLDKAEAHATAKKYDTSVLMAARLAPDMLPFARQIQIASDTVKFCVARLAGVEGPKFEDTEASFDDLRARVRKTVDYLQSVPVAQIEGSEDRDIALPRRDGTLILKGEAYLKHYVLPNFFFHVTTAYALLRHNGVELGKRDFLGPLN
ncbi:MAG TPA: DUF1993 domain-containing protein [Albitalea sp.]|nr:DUF1993 domain-containing protein [Albitalea sp.]